MAAIRAMLAAGERPTDVAGRRRRLERLTARYEMPADVALEGVDANGVRAEWTSTPAADPARVIMFLHGGGYVSGSIKSHRHMIAQAGREAGTRTLALDYRLAPEHPFPAALDDALTGYRFLLSQGFMPENIVIAGESAGGGLAIATLVSLREAGTALPACAWCSSPWTDLEMSGATMQTKAAVDPLIQRPYLQELAAAYLHGRDPRMPMVSPIFADLHGLPPLLIQVGSDETLLDDAIRLAGVAAAADVRTTLQIWPHMIHAWHLFYTQLADGRRALAEMGAFVRATLG
ncbi:alpha/beta hydrolase [Bosea sp. WAO]|uniref:alpha/beta hydrolase n=1 Tax=Bosea sp. WAO TaxID=406341 RepID=UPI0007485E0F|nr:alpha/beta hydrolase [Bosea sp. WAO]KUL94526.1 alpha/beta hydrolase [Bosea sp. WAO]